MLPASRDIWQGHPSTQAWKIDQQQPESITELHHAAWTGDVGALQVLLGQGSSFGTPDKAGHTPLHYAAAGGQAGSVRLLIQHGANVHAVSTNGDTALHVAAAQGSTAAIEALLTQGADASNTNDRDQTPLYCAVEHQHTAAAHLLGSVSPATVNKADEWGLTPLHIASRSGNVNIVTALILCQADPLQQSWDKRTALHFAAQHRHPALQNPADHFRWQKHLLNLKDHQGNTALHVAVIEGMTEPVQVLLQDGADINTLGQQQQTPLMLARQFKHIDVEHLLTQAGAT
ncbi:hypothetical protein WJX79_007768 [Trebouxia sp. C0005]